MVKICPNCGKENQDSFKFCENCGQKLENALACACNIDNETIDNEAKEENTTERNTNTTNIPKRPTQFCKYCGEKIDAEAEICPKCGVRLKNPVSEKSPAIALILSFILPGIGQLYNGQTKKCVTLLIGAIISAILTIIVIGSLLYLVIWIYGMYDAYKSAKALNNGELLEDKIFS